MLNSKAIKFSYEYIYTLNEVTFYAPLKVTGLNEVIFYPPL